ncbi:HYC_CC_PP family protein [Leeuwenhoekiella aequorea]
MLSFFLAVFILFSTSSFTVDMHFCCNKLVDMAFFSKAESCMEIVQKKDNNSKQCTSIQEKSCCDNQTIVKEGDDTFKKSNTILEIDTLVFINTFFNTYINLFEGLEENVISFKTYRSPLLSTDIIILNETFLI